MDFDFTGKTVLVTGGSTGIGNASARAFLAAGARVIVTGTRATAADYAGEDGDLAGLEYHRLDQGDCGRRRSVRSRHRQPCRARRRRRQGRLSAAGVRDRNLRRCARHQPHRPDAARRQVPAGAGQGAGQHHLHRIGRQLSRHHRPTGLFGVKGRPADPDQDAGTGVWRRRHPRQPRSPPALSAAR